MLHQSSAISCHSMTIQPFWSMPARALEGLLGLITDQAQSLRALEAYAGHSLAQIQDVSLRHGVAIVPMVGPLFRYGNALTRLGLGVSIEVLATNIQSALNNPQVKAIILNIDSSGGEVSGINELSEMIYNARARKPIHAYIGGSGTSAAYWIASATQKITLDATAMLGSIGVMTEVVIPADSKNTQRYTLLSKNAAKKRPDLNTEAGRTQLGGILDALENVFLTKVARNLNVSPKNLIAMGNQGGIRVGADAVKSGLAHQLGSLESLLAQLSGRSVSSYHAPQQRFHQEGCTMKKHLSFTSTQQTHARAQAIAAERARAKSIMSRAKPGFESVAYQAIADGLSVETAIQRLERAERQAVLKGIVNGARSHR